MESRSTSPLWHPISGSPGAVAIVRSAVALGHEHGLEVVADSVETRPLWDRLAELGCDVVQGDYIDVPMLAPSALCAERCRSWATERWSLRGGAVPGRTKMCTVLRLAFPVSWRTGWRRLHQCGALDGVTLRPTAGTFHARTGALGRMATARRNLIGCKIMVYSLSSE